MNFKQFLENAENKLAQVNLVRKIINKLIYQKGLSFENIYKMKIEHLKPIIQELGFDANFLLVSQVKMFATKELETEKYKDMDVGLFRKNYDD